MAPSSIPFNEGDPPPVDLQAEAPPEPIPEPASLLLFATGLVFVVIAMVRRRTG